MGRSASFERARLPMKEAGAREFPGLANSIRLI
jgi:hypothetical protein